MARYSSGADAVTKWDFKYILELLEAHTDWREDIMANLPTTKSSPHSFDVLSVSDYQQRTHLGTSTPGVTLKQTGDILMQEWYPSKGAGADKTSFLSGALHECVHLVSHPPQQGATTSTAYTKLGEGLSEGLVEYVTRDVLAANKIALAGGRMLGHPERTKIVAELVKRVGTSLLSKVLFKGDDGQFTMVMEFAYSKLGWKAIMNYAGGGPADQVIPFMDDLHKKEDEKRKQADSHK